LLEKSFLSPEGMKAAGITKPEIRIKIVPIGAIFILKKQIISRVMG
jgi:hypothetical protein